MIYFSSINILIFFFFFYIFFNFFFSIYLVCLNIALNDSSIPRNILRSLMKGDEIPASTVRMLLYALFSITLPLPLLPDYDIYARSVSEDSSSSSSSSSSSTTTTSSSNHSNSIESREEKKDEPLVNSKFVYTKYSSNKERIFNEEIVKKLMRIAVVHSKDNRELTVICYSILYNLCQYRLYLYI